MATSGPLECSIRRKPSDFSHSIPESASCLLWAAAGAATEHFIVAVISSGTEGSVQGAAWQDASAGLQDVCAKMDVTMSEGVLSCDHLPMFVEIRARLCERLRAQDQRAVIA